MFLSLKHEHLLHQMFQVSHLSINLNTTSSSDVPDVVSWLLSSGTQLTD